MAIRIRNFSADSLQESGIRNFNLLNFKFYLNREHKVQTFYTFVLIFIQYAALAN